MSNDKQAKMLARVRALLAKAESTSEPGEANVFRAKADELMTLYAIEEWQLAASDDSESRQPVRRDIDFSWYKSDNPVNSGLWRLLRTVYRHARCAPMASYISWNAGTIPVVGLPADLDYADMLFTHLMIDMLRQIDPEPDAELGYHTSLRKLKEAGMSWPEIEAKMSRMAGMLPEVDAMLALPRKQREHKMTRDYRAWVKREGIPQSYNNHKTWRRSFSDGYASEIARRLAGMRNDQEHRDQERRSPGSDSMALALMDIRTAVDRAAAEMFAGQHKTAKSVSRNLSTNYAARGEGSSAGRKASIANRGGSRIGQRRQLPR